MVHVLKILHMCTILFLEWKLPSYYISLSNYVWTISFEEKSPWVYDHVIFDYVNVSRHMNSTQIADVNTSGLKLLRP